MESRKRITVLLLLSILLSVAVAHQSSSNEDSSVESDRDSDSQGSSSSGPQIQRRSGLYHGSGLHYHLPATTGFAYAAKPYYTPVVKYPVYKSYAATPAVYHQNHHVHAYAHHARPQYQLQHGGASVSSYNVNYPRYPLYRPVLKVPATTFLKPTVLSAPGFVPSAPSFIPSAPAVYPQKPIIPIAFNPVLPTAARPFVYPQQSFFNPSILNGLNPQFVPVSVSNGAVFTNYPTLAPAPIAPSQWRPIAVPTVPTINVQRPSISILPPLGAPSSTLATFADPIHVQQQQHHHFAQHVPSTVSSQVLSDEHHHHQFLPSGIYFIIRMIALTLFHVTCV